ARGHALRSAAALLRQVLAPPAPGGFLPGDRDPGLVEVRGRGRAGARRDRLRAPVVGGPRPGPRHAAPRRAPLLDARGDRRARQELQHPPAPYGALPADAALPPPP